MSASLATGIAVGLAVSNAGHSGGGSEVEALAFACFVLAMFVGGAIGAVWNPGTYDRVESAFLGACTAALVGILVFALAVVSHFTFGWPA